MFVCLCNPFSDSKVRDYLENSEGRVKVGEAYRACSGGESPQCCTCLNTLKEMVKGHNKTVKATDAISAAP